MTIRLTQLDGKLPNLALMKLSHWYKEQGHVVVFKRSILLGGDEPYYDVVYGSTIFSSTMGKVGIFKTQFPHAVVGGTGHDLHKTVEQIIGCGEGEYEHYDYGLYPDFTHSIGFTQRGCRLRCKFCVVPSKEGKNVGINTVNDIWRGPGHPKKIHLLDNDFFGQVQWEDRCKEIIEGNFSICLNQGINIRLIHKEGAFYLANMKYYDDSFKHRRIYTAWDNKRDEAIFMRGVELLLNAGVRPNDIMVYFLCGYWEGETFNDIWYRFSAMVKLGLKPYPMIYRRDDGRTNTEVDYRILKKFQTWVVRGYYHTITWAEWILKQI